MHPRRPTPEHQEAVSRRLAQLSADLAEARPSWGDEAGVSAVRAAPERLEVPEVPGGAGARSARRPPSPASGGPAVVVVPETLRGRVALGPPQVAVLALLIALGLAVTCWWVVRGTAHEIAAPRVDGAGLAAGVRRRAALASRRGRCG